MWPDSCVLVVINAFIFLVDSLPPNIWNTLRNDSDSVAQNERILKLFLQLAMHAANHLTHLRKETDKGYDCNKRNDSLSISMTEALITQLPSQADLEWLDKSKKMNYSSSDDFEINVDQNQTASLKHPQLQELFDPGNLQNINDQDVIHNLSSKLTNLIPKYVQDTSSDTTENNHEALNTDTLQKSILNLNTTSNPLNTSKFGSDSRKSARDDINEKLLNQIDLKNTSVTNDLTKTVNKFLPEPQTLQEPTFGISQRLFGTDLAQIVPKITSNVHENTNQHIPLQNTEESSDRIGNINQRFLDPVIIKNSGNILSRQVAYNLSVVKQILSSMKNIMESMIKVLSEAAKSASNLPNQIISGFQNTINRLLKIAEEGRKYLHSNYTQQEQSKTAKQAGNQFNDLLHNRQDLISNTKSNIREAVNASGKNDLNTTANDLPINDDNSTEINNKQYVSTLLKDSSTPLFRLLPDFNKHSSKIETALSSVQTNDNVNSFTKEKQSINDHKKIDQIDEEIRAKGFKRMNETRMDYSDYEQLNPISEDLSQKSKESALIEIAVTTSTSPNQLESNTFTIMEQAKSSSDAQDSGNVSNIIKSDLIKVRRLQDNLSANDGNQSIENQVTHIDNPLQSNSSFIDDLKDENLHKQLSGTKLQEISDQLINTFWPIMEKRMANNRSYMTGHYNKSNKNLLSNMLPNSTIN